MHHGDLADGRVEPRLHASARAEVWDDVGLAEIESQGQIAAEKIVGNHHRLLIRRDAREIAGVLVLRPRAQVFHLDSLAARTERDRPARAPVERRRRGATSTGLCMGEGSLGEDDHTRAVRGKVERDPHASLGIQLSGERRDPTRHRIPGLSLRPIDAERGLNLLSYVRRVGDKVDLSVRCAAVNEAEVRHTGREADVRLQAACERLAKTLVLVFDERASGGRPGEQAGRDRADL